MIIIFWSSVVTRKKACPLGRISVPSLSKPRGAHTQPSQTASLAIMEKISLEIRPSGRVTHACCTTGCVVCRQCQLFCCTQRSLKAPNGALPWQRVAQAAMTSDA